MLVRLHVSQTLDGKIHQCYTKEFEASNQFLFVNCVQAWVTSFVRNARYGERLSLTVEPPENLLPFVGDEPPQLRNTKMYVSK